VSRSEFEALKRFEIMRIPNSISCGLKVIRVSIYCDDVEKWSFGLITPGFCSMLEEAYDKRHRNKGSNIAMEKSEKRSLQMGREDSLKLSCRGMTKREKKSPNANESHRKGRFFGWIGCRKPRNPSSAILSSTS
jgi:hypothetical protein